MKKIIVIISIALFGCNNQSGERTTKYLLDSTRMANDIAQEQWEMETKLLNTKSELIVKYVKSGYIDDYEGKMLIDSIYKNVNNVWAKKRMDSCANIVSANLKRRIKADSIKHFSKKR